jgi:exodeoxyribonuclease VII large subunit
MAGPRTPDPADVLSVAAVNRLAKQSLEESFPSLWVSGEISRISRAASGHYYVTIKDESASMDTTIFKSVVLRMRFDLKEGLQVLIRGRLTLYEARGQFQLNVSEVLPRGIGQLELAFQQLKERLQANGYFETGRKKKLPRFPRSIAIVTSPSGAAIRDMLELLARRWPVAAVLVVPVRVQGDGSAGEIAAAVRALNQLHAAEGLAIDVVIVGRGGGSLEDLWAFNDEQVADAIFASRIPVISAVGHEIDFTISDMVADHRALTPSHAITDLTPDLAELLAGLDELQRQLAERMARRMEFLRQRVQSLAERRTFRNPLDRVRELERRLDDFDGRLRRAVTLPVEKGRNQIASAASRLESLSPLNVLSRGYSMTFASSGGLIHDAANIEIGDHVRTRLAVGEFVSRIEEIALSEETT